MDDSGPKLHLEIPFKTSEEATIAYNTLTVDKEPKRSQVIKTLSVIDNRLIVYVKPRYTSVEALCSHFLRTPYLSPADDQVIFPSGRKLVPSYLCNMQTKGKETEYSPSPQPSRGIYGFIFASLCVLFIFSYFLWLVIPASIIDTWPYQPPQKYWAVAVPIFFCTALFLFAFFIYPSLHSVHDGELDDLSAITDRHAISRDASLPNLEQKVRFRSDSRKRNHDNNRRDKMSEDLRGVPIPSASDIKIEDISRILYSQDHR